MTESQAERIAVALEKIAAILTEGTKIGGFLNNGRSSR